MSANGGEGPYTEETVEAPTFLPNGTVIAGRFRVLRPIGAGAMGVVYLAERVGATHERVALKLLPPALAINPTLAARLRREAANVQAVRHPNVVRLVEHGDCPEHGPYIALDYLEGEPLSRRVASSRRIPPATAVAFAMDMLAALEASHAAGVVHRDLKPGNVFLVPQPASPEGPATERATLLDFGISRVIADGVNARQLRLTRTGAIVGTPAYMAPEQAMGATDQDHRVDLYAVGVLLYQMLAGALPHVGANYNQVLAHALTSDPVPLRDRCPELDAELAAIVHRAMARRPSARYPSAAEFRAALASWSTRGPRTRAATPPPVPPQARARAAPPPPLPPPPAALTHALRPLTVPPTVAPIATSTDETAAFYVATRPPPAPRYRSPVAFGIAAVCAAIVVLAAGFTARNASPVATSVAAVAAQPNAPQPRADARGARAAVAPARSVAPAEQGSVARDAGAGSEAPTRAQPSRRYRSRAHARERTERDAAQQTATSPR